MLEFVPARQVQRRLSEGWQIFSYDPRDYAAVMYAPEGWRPLLLDNKKPFRTCSVPGCEAKHYGHGYCDKHTKRIKRLGTPNLESKAGRYRCSEEGCDRQRRSRGLCNMHVQRVRRAERKAAFECSEAA